MIGAVIPAAGSGSRMGGDTPKQFLEIDGIPILVLTVGRFLQVSKIHQIVVPLPANRIEQAEQLFRQYFSQDLCKRLLCVAGGRTRQESVLAGLDALTPETRFVLVHDGARPFVSGKIIESCIQAVINTGAVIAAVPVRDTIKRVDGGRIVATVDRSQLWHAQTPQGAAVDLLRRAYDIARQKGFAGTDEASLLEHAGIGVAVIEGSEENIKITRPDDLKLAGNINKGV